MENIALQYLELFRVRFGGFPVAQPLRYKRSNYCVANEQDTVNVEGSRVFFPTLLCCLMLRTSFGLGVHRGRCRSNCLKEMKSASIVEFLARGIKGKDGLVVLGRTF